MRPKLITVLISSLLLTCYAAFGQTTQKMIIHPLQEPQQVHSLIADSLFGGGGVISNVQYNIDYNLDGIGSFEEGGATVGFQKGVVLSNGYVKALEGPNIYGAAMNERDLLGDHIDDPDLNKMLTYISGSTKGDTVHDASVITFKFKPFYTALQIAYVIGSEEYLFEGTQGKPDVNMTDSVRYDVSGIFYNTHPGNYELYSVFYGTPPPPPMPVALGFINDHSYNIWYKGNSLERPLWTELDGMTTPLLIFTWVTPCQDIYFKIGVADNYIYMVNPETNEPIGAYINSAIFLKAGSLISCTQMGYAPEWTVSGESDNANFDVDELVEGGCSRIIITLERNIQGFYEDTLFIGFKIQGASPGEYTLTPEPFNDTVLVILPESEIYTYLLEAIDDGIPENPSGPEEWNFRYQQDPCDLPNLGGFGTGYEGYSGVIPLRVYDYEPISSANKTYGPNPQSIYTCGNDVTVTVTDITEGGIPPLHYLWSHPASGTIGNGEDFTFPLSGSPDVAYCTISDKCSGIGNHEPKKDTIIVHSSLSAIGSPDFQLCENLDWPITIENCNVGDEYDIEWYFQDSLISTNHTYLVMWDEYGSYFPVVDSLVFGYIVIDNCGNTAQGNITAFGDPIVEIVGANIICRGEQAQFSCTQGQSYDWSLDGNIIFGANEMTLLLDTDTLSPGNHELCVEIINACNMPASSCFQFEISELNCEVTLNGLSDFTVCPFFEFVLHEINATSDWNWSWYDDGAYHSAVGQSISLNLKDAGTHDITISAYNQHGCYDQVTFQVDVYPHTSLSAFSLYDSVCVGTSTSLWTEYDINPVTYYWVSLPEDISLSGQETNPGPVVAPGEPTLYTCYVEDENGCLDTAGVFVDTRPPIAGNIIATPMPACTSEPITIDFSTISPLANVDFQWSFQGGSPATSTEKVVDVTWDESGLKSITLDITEPGCEFTMNYSLNIDIKPQPMIEAINSAGCAPHEVSFRDLSSQVANPAYLWDFGDGQNSTMKDPVHLYEYPGTYDVTLSVRNGSGCETTQTFGSWIEIYPQPVSGFDANPISATINNPKIEFSEQVDGYYTFIEWNFGDGSFSNEDNPVYYYTHTGEYDVIQYIENEHGCWDSDTLRVFISEELMVFIPNAFSPNGDGLNDCFSISGTTGDIVDKFTVNIFDRWGKTLIYRNIDSPDCLWDGRDKSGKVVPVGSYPYIIIGTDFQGKDHVFKGTVTVVL